MNENNTHGSADHNLSAPELTKEESHLALIYQTANFAASLNVAASKQKLQQKIRNRKLKRVFTKTLSLAASAVLLFAVWRLSINEVKQVDEEMLNTSEVPQRIDKALLMLSDGRLIALDTATSLQLSESAMAKISSLNGNMLTYQAVDGEINTSESNKIIVPAGGRFQLQLSDGTKVWLNAASSLSFPVVFGKDDRLVELSGEAFFEVVPDPRPFIVKLAESSIQVLGTSFNVSAYGEDDFEETTLVNGSLRVHTPDGNVNVLKPGQQHKLHTKTLEQTVNLVDTKFYTSWREGVIYFNRISLKELAIKLERWYDVDVVFESEKSATLLFTGAVENSRRIDFLLNLISQASGIEFSINGKLITIK